MLNKQDKDDMQFLISYYCEMFEFVLGQPFIRGKKWLRRQPDKYFEQEYFQVLNFLRENKMYFGIGKSVPNCWCSYLKHCLVEAKREGLIPTVKFITYPVRLKNYFAKDLGECYEVDREARTIIKRKSQLETQRLHFPNHGKPWTAEDRILVANQFKAGVSIPEISKLLGRKLGAIQSELYHQKLVDSFRLPEELAKLDTVEESEYEEITEIISEHPLLKPIPPQEPLPEIDYSKTDIPEDLTDKELAFMGLKRTNDGRIVSRVKSKLYEGSPKPGVTKRIVKRTPTPANHSP